jgi:hypothetical protein
MAPFPYFYCASARSGPPRNHSDSYEEFMGISARCCIESAARRNEADFGTVIQTLCPIVTN